MIVLYIQANTPSELLFENLDKLLSSVPSDSVPTFVCGDFNGKQAMHAGFAPVVYNPTKTGCLLVFLDKSNKQLDLQDRKFMTVSCMKNTASYT
jgi:hypothetical protein